MTDVVSNTSPLSYLHKLRHLDLLRRLFGTILVPTAVVIELRVGRDAGHDLPEPELLPWISIAPPRPKSAAVSTVGDMDPGEAAVLDLALALPKPLVLLDERIARRGAAVLGIPCVGTIGIILEAKKRGLVPSISPLFAELERLRFRFSSQLKKWALEQGGES